MSAQRLKATLLSLYEGKGPSGWRARWGLLLFDLAVLLFFVVTSFLPLSPALVAADFVLGTVLLLELLARLWAAADRLNFITRPIALLDVAVLVSLLAPALTENFAFLRVVRTLRLLRSYRVLLELRSSSRFFARNEEVIFAGLNLLVFLFVVSSVVYVLQAYTNPAISHYIDALYFTVTTLTTTGFGDITLDGPSGRLLSIVIMIVGVGLFLNLARAIFRPAKVRYECPDCGLNRHDPDAVHCKHCGRLLHIRTEGS
jgi:voltage-gated potassium channel